MFSSFPGWCSNDFSDFLLLLLLLLLLFLFDDGLSDVT